MRKERFCPICRQSADTFNPYGVAQTPDAQCPNCGSMERYRLLFLYLFNETDLFKKPNTLIEIGPRKEFSQLLRSYPNIKYVGSDLSVNFDHPRSNLEADMNFMPFSANLADFVIAYHVLEHLPKPQSGLLEIKRILKPGGIAFLQVSIDINRSSTYEDPNLTTDEDRIRIYGQKDHLRIFGNDFDKFISDAGFSVNRVKYVEKFSPKTRTLLGLKDTFPLQTYTTCEDIFIAVKPIN
jgi:SAM-dependent methyltransferase